MGGSSNSTGDNPDGAYSTLDVYVAAIEPNHPPVAVDDAYSAGEGVPLVVPALGVLANDTDPNGDALTAALATPPANGTVVLNADGSFTYTTTFDDFVGTDSFTYTASDGEFTDTATVTITVIETVPAICLTTRVRSSAPPATTCCREPRTTTSSAASAATTR